MRGPSCQLALSIKFQQFYITHQLISDITFLYQLAKARPHNVLRFLVLYQDLEHYITEWVETPFACALVAIYVKELGPYLFGGIKMYKRVVN